MKFKGIAIPNGFAWPAMLVLDDSFGLVMNSAQSFFALLLCVPSVLCTNYCFAQEITIPAPAGMSAESVKRIEKEYQKEIEAFGKLLLELDRNRFRQPEDSIQLPIPASVDDESVERVKSDYHEQFAQFSEFLFALDRNRLRPRTDNLSTIHLKQTELTQQLSNWYSNLSRAIRANSDLVMNYIYFCNDVCPRLSGRVIKVGPKSEFETISSALSAAEAGDSLQLEPGEFEFGSTSALKLNDIEIRGDRAGSKIKLNRARAMRDSKLTRFRFMNIEFNCDNTQLEIGRESKVEFRDCQFSNYNSGSGGSNAISGRNNVVLFENCLFDGKAGRAAGRGSGGNAFDLRGNDLLYLRNTKFIDNGNLNLRRAVIDKCAVQSSDEHLARFRYVYGNIVKVRNS